MKRDDIVRKVKVKINDTAPLSGTRQFMADVLSEGGSLDVLIQENVAAACDFILKVAPLHMIKESVEDIADEVDSEMEVRDEVGYLEIPSDFLRIHTAMMSNWDRSVNTTILAVEDDYKLQRNKHTRGKLSKPVVAINNGMFELYSIIDKPTCEVFTYIPTTPQDIDDIEDSIAEMVILEIAIVVCDALKDIDRANLLSKELNELLYK